jgi:hypothetical protein
MRSVDDEIRLYLLGTILRMAMFLSHALCFGAIDVYGKVEYLVFETQIIPGICIGPALKHSHNVRL